MTTYTADKAAWSQVQCETHEYLHRILAAQKQARGNNSIVSALAGQFNAAYSGLDRVEVKLGIA